MPQIFHACRPLSVGSRRAEEEAVPQSSAEWLEGTLAGDARATRAFVSTMRPVVQARIARALLRFSSRAAGRDTRQEVDDLTQDVFGQLFANDARVLRRWSPTKGLSLANFVGLVAHRHATKTLMSDRRSPWSEEPMLDAALDRASGSTEPERQIVQRDLLVTVLQQVRAELSPRACLLFEALVVERRPIPEVAELTGLSPAALYQWRSRLARRAREIAATFSSDSTLRRQSPALEDR